jgi:outer membrane protein assembly factor BamE (lipoprotein component of BamABCDE complex)
MNRAIGVGCAFLAAFLAGCATHQQGQSWWTLHGQDFAAITPGTTTKQDVERLVGTPLLAMTFRNLDEDVWDYRYLEGTRLYVAEVHFDMQGRTKYYTTYPDRCGQRAMPCR